MCSINKPQKFNIVIVGAGISGLSAALGLQQKGHKVTVLERHADTQALGGPINMSPSATHVLTHYGLKEKIFEQLKPKNQPIYFRRFENGKPLGTIPLGAPEKLYGSGIWVASRYGYQKVFRQAAEERGIEIRFSTTVQTIDVESAVVVLAGGEKIEADLIIGADGIGSRVRPLVVDQELERRNPVGAFNVDVPLSHMMDDPELAELAGEKQNFWMGPGGSFAGGAVQDAGVYNGIFMTEEKLGTEGEWFVKGDLDAIIRRYDGWDPRIVRLLKLVKEEDCYIWNLTDLPSLRTWSNGRTVLIGDAAHATLPYLGLGATTCVEDGASLAECLDRAKDVEDIPRILKAFEAIRRSRVESVIKYSRITMTQWHLPDGKEQIQRDEFWGQMESLNRSNYAWDGTHVDEPPESWMDPLLPPYFRGHKTEDFTNRKLDQMGV